MLSKRLQDFKVEDAKTVSRLFSYCCKVALTIGFTKENLAAALAAFAEQLVTTEKSLEYFANFDHDTANMDQEKLDAIKDRVNDKFSGWKEF